MQAETIKSINGSQITTDYGIRTMINDQNLRIGQQVYCQGDYVMGWEQPPYIITEYDKPKNYTGFFSGYDLYSISDDNILTYENSSSSNFYKKDLYPADSYKNLGFNRFYEYIYSFYLKKESGSSVKGNVLNLYLRIFVGDVFQDFLLIYGFAKGDKIDTSDSLYPDSYRENLADSILSINFYSEITNSRMMFGKINLIDY